MMAVNIAASLLALAVLPAGHVVEGLGAGFGLANVVGAVVAWRILARRLRRPGRAADRAPAWCGCTWPPIPAVLFAWRGSSWSAC